MPQACQTIRIVRYGWFLLSLTAVDIALIFLFLRNIKDIALDLLRSLLDFILHIDRHLVEIVSEYQTWTYLILFLIIFAETGFVVTPFLPGDSLIFAIGALIAKGNTGLDIYFMAVILIIAAILGNTVNYFLGSYLGVRVFKEENRILKRSYYVKTQDFFNKHGGKAVIFSRFMPIIRTVAPFVAGVGKMAFGRYTTYNVIGGVSWILSFLVLGYSFGSHPAIKDNFVWVIFGITVLSVAPAIIPIVKSRFSKKSEPAA